MHQPFRRRALRLGAAVAWRRILAASHWRRAIGGGQLIGSLDTLLGTGDAIRPQYARAFRCIGPACEDDCCHGWGVSVDRVTYEGYQLIPAESLLRPVMEAHLELLPEPRSERLHAQILLNQTGACPFLNEERWCKIQLELGAESLSQTCAGYPRVENAFDGVVEQTLQLSCPEAARLVLLRDWDEVGEAEELDADGASGIHDPPGYEETPFGAMRRFLILLLRNRKYPLWQRLFVMGVFSNRLSGLLAGGHDDRIAKLLVDYETIVADGRLGPAMAGIVAQPEMQLAVVLRLVDMRMGRVLSSLRFLECTKDFLDGIKYRPGRAVAELVQNYSEAYECWYAPFLWRHPHLLENYLLNHVFKSGFPYSASQQPAEKGRSCSAGYLELATHFALIKGLLIGMAGLHRAALGPDHVVKLVQSYGRMVEHHAQFVREVVAFVGEQTGGNAAGMAMLLRN